MKPTRSQKEWSIDEKPKAKGTEQRRENGWLCAIEKNGCSTTTTSNKSGNRGSVQMRGERYYLSVK